MNISIRIVVPTEATCPACPGKPWSKPWSVPWKRAVETKPRDLLFSHFQKNLFIRGANLTCGTELARTNNPDTKARLLRDSRNTLDFSNTPIAWLASRLRRSALLRRCQNQLAHGVEHRETDQSGRFGCRIDDGNLLRLPARRRRSVALQISQRRQPHTRQLT